MNVSVLETNRLKLIPLSSSFCQQYYVDWLNDYEVYKFLESGGNYTIKTLKEYLENIEKLDIYFWAIIIKNSEKHIGNIKIDPIDFEKGTGEYGIMLGDRSEWGKGYAREASIKVITESFEKVQLEEITLGFVESNTTANKLYSSLAFEQDGLPRKYLRANGVTENIIRMKLLKKNWLIG